MHPAYLCLVYLWLFLRCCLCSDTGTRLTYRSQPDSATQHSRSHSPSAPSRKRIRAELDLPHPSIGSDPSAQAWSDECMLDEGHSGFDGSPGPTEQDELTADQPRPEADLGGTGSSDDPGDPPLDESHKPHNRDVDADGTQAGDGHVYAGRDVQPDDFPGGPNDWNTDDFVPHLDVMRRSAEFIQGIHEVNLDNDPLLIDVRERLQTPISEPLLVSKELCLCLDLYLATTNGSQATYTDVCTAIKWFSPDAELLLHKQFTRKLTELTGVVPVMADMCTNSCVAYMGPFSDFQTCPICSTAHYKTVT